MKTEYSNDTLLNDPDFISDVSTPAAPEQPGVWFCNESIIPIRHGGTCHVCGRTREQSDAIKS